VVNGAVAQHGEQNVAASPCERDERLVVALIDVAVRVDTLPDSPLIAGRLRRWSMRSKPPSSMRGATKGH